MEWRAHDSYHLDSIDLVAIDRRGQKPAYVTTKFTRHEIEPCELIPEPTLRLLGDEAQQLMNELWRIGIRPRDGNGTQAHTDGLQAHLSDLRAIAFHALKMK